MKKILSKRTTALFILMSLFISNLAHAHQGLFSHATINQPVLHLLFHSMVLVLLGVIVFLISRWWLKRSTKTVAQRSQSK